MIWLFNSCFSDFWSFDWILSPGRKFCLLFLLGKLLNLFSLWVYEHMIHMNSCKEIKTMFKNVKRLKLFVRFLFLLLPPGSAWRRGATHQRRSFLLHILLCLKPHFTLTCASVNTLTHAAPMWATHSRKKRGHFPQTWLPPPRLTGLWCASPYNLNVCK